MRKYSEFRGLSCLNEPASIDQAAARFHPLPPPPPLLQRHTELTQNPPSHATTSTNSNQRIGPRGSCQGQAAGACRSW